MEVLHGPCNHERLLRIIKHMRQGVHSNLIVASVHTHSLLTHRTLIRITRRLVVVGERDDRSAHSQNHGGMDLTVSVAVLLSLLLLGLAFPLGILSKVMGEHSNHRILLFLNIK